MCCKTREERSVAVVITYSVKRIVEHVRRSDFHIEEHLSKYGTILSQPTV